MGERRGRSVVQSVRLPAEAFAAIEEVAEARTVGPESHPQGPTQPSPHAPGLD